MFTIQGRELMRVVSVTALVLTCVSILVMPNPR